MSLEFGLTITLLGIVSVFLALTLVGVACGILKRAFKEERAELPPPPAPADATVLKEEISEEEEAAVAAAIMAYMSGTPPVPRLTRALGRGTQPIIWNMAGRMDSMELRVRRS